jgi:hypothetical protein
MRTESISVRHAVAWVQCSSASEYTHVQSEACGVGFNVTSCDKKAKVQWFLCVIKHHALKTLTDGEIWLHAYLISTLGEGEWSA